MATHADVPRSGPVTAARITTPARPVSGLAAAAHAHGLAAGSGRAAPGRPGIGMMASAYASMRLYTPPLPGTGSPQMASSNKPANIPSGTGSTAFLERTRSGLEPEAASDDLLHDLGGAAEDRLDPAEPPEPTIAPEISRLLLPPVKAGLPAAQRGPRRSRGAIWAAITRHGIVSPRRSSPSRGVAPTTTLNQRLRISRPSTRTSTSVSSSRHSRHRSS